MQTFVFASTVVAAGESCAKPDMVGLAESEKDLPTLVSSDDEA